MSDTMQGRGNTIMYKTQSLLLRCSEFCRKRKTTASKVTDTKMEVLHAGECTA